MTAASWGLCLVLLLAGCSPLRGALGYPSPAPPAAEPGPPAGSSPEPAPELPPTETSAAGPGRSSEEEPSLASPPIALPPLAATPGTGSTAGAGTPAAPAGSGVPAGSAAPPRAVPVPATTPATPGPGPGEMPPLAPQLTLRLPPDQEQRLREETRRRLDDTEKVIRQLEARPLSSRDRETLALAHSLVDQARKAYQAQEWERAANLSTKARTLAEDLSGSRK